MKTTLLSILCALLFVGCAETMSPIAPDVRHEVVIVNKKAATAVEVYGTVHYVDIGGGFYGIVADNGNHIYPLNLPAKYQKEGIYAKFTGSYSSVNTGVMWGKAFLINSLMEY